METVIRHQDKLELILKEHVTEHGLQSKQVIQLTVPQAQGKSTEQRRKIQIVARLPQQLELKRMVPLGLMEPVIFNQV